jgi:hypothetical protein
MATAGWEAKGTKWTYGAEFELSDWDQRRNHTWRTDIDWTMVNSNGIAVDPRGEVYWQGGEILTSPSQTPGGVVDQLGAFLKRHPEASVNYRSNLHIHVRVPGLREDLKRLKRLQNYCSLWLPQLFPLIEPIPVPLKMDYPDPAAFQGARKRYSRRKISHQKILSHAVVTRQAAAGSPQEFFEAEARHPKTGKLHWAICPRAAVNLRQMLTTDTIEFRHFPGTIDLAAVRTAVNWCLDFLELAFDNEDPVYHYKRYYRGRTWPKFHPYVHWMEERYKETNPHFVPKEQAKLAVERILKECASSSSATGTATARRSRRG